MKNKILILVIASLVLSVAILVTVMVKSPNGIKEIEEAREQSPIVMVDFWAHGCKPCREISPIIDEIASEYPEVEVLKVNTNTDKKMLKKYGIRYIPTVIIYYEQEEFARLVGKHEKHEYTFYLDVLLMNINENFMTNFMVEVE